MFLQLQSLCQTTRLKGFASITDSLLRDIPQVLIVCSFGLGRIGNGMLSSFRHSWNGTLRVPVF